MKLVLKDNFEMVLRFLVSLGNFFLHTTIRYYQKQKSFLLKLWNFRFQNMKFYKCTAQDISSKNCHISCTMAKNALCYPLYKARRPDISIYMYISESALSAQYCVVIHLVLIMQCLTFV